MTTVCTMYLFVTDGKHFLLASKECATCEFIIYLKFAFGHELCDHELSELGLKIWF